MEDICGKVMSVAHFNKSTDNILRVTCVYT